MLRERRQSFVEMYSYDTTARATTARRLPGLGLLHHREARGHRAGRRARSRTITSVKIHAQGRALAARVVDSGDAQVEVDPGDWAILKVKETIDLPALDSTGLRLRFADPIFRLGNDYSKGSSSRPQRGPADANNLVTCLTDGHPACPGRRRAERRRAARRIPIGRCRDYRFSFILRCAARCSARSAFLN
jgi:hypothetical protein